MVINPGCSDPCPVRELRRGRFRLKALGVGRGLAFGLKLQGLEVEGAPGVSGNLPVRVVVGLSRSTMNGGNCVTYESATLPVKRGKLNASFTSSDLTPAFPGGLGVVRLCGATVLTLGGEPFAVDGLVM